MTRKKLTYRVLTIGIFVLINIFILFGISQILHYLNTGADPSSIFHGDLRQEQYYKPSVIWEPLNNEGRPMEDNTLKEIHSDYLNSWYVKNQAFQNLDSSLLDDYFTKAAKSNLASVIDQNRREKVKVESTTFAHQLTLEFYSDDGTMVVLSDKNVRNYSKILKDGIILDETDATFNYRIVMLLEDGFWRIRHFEQTEINLDVSPPRKKVHFPETLSGMNYYPKQSPWDTFGAAFSEQQLNEDFHILSGLNLNTIRVFVGYDDFGGADVAPEKLDKLEQLMDIAAKNNLQVIVTLFDFYGDYRVSDWSRTSAHLRTIARRILKHPALHSWDLKNEPNLDFESRGRANVISWLSHMLFELRKEDALHPITIGWSSPEAALTLEKEVDYVSFHFYERLSGLSEAVKLLGEATDKPLVLQEFGKSTYRGFWNPFGASEEKQYAYYEAFFKIQKRDNLHYLSWTLFDFDTVPSRVVGNYPWRKNKQLEFGIIDQTGERKKAFDLFKHK